MTGRGVVSGKGAVKAIAVKELMGKAINYYFDS
jgi:hypothetical protein